MELFLFFMFKAIREVVIDFYILKAPFFVNLGIEIEMKIYGKKHYENVGTKCRPINHKDLFIEGV